MRGRPGTEVETDTYTPVKERPVVDRPKIEPPRSPKQSDPGRGAVLKKVKTIKRIRSLLEHNRPGEAYELLRRTQHLISGWHLPAEDHLTLAEALEQEQRWDEAVSLWEDYVEHHPQSAEHIRVRAAGVILDRQQRPHAALRMLDPITNARLHPDLEKQRKRIVAAAQKLIDNGVIELDQAAWH
jgi:hypothetical protein